MRHDSGAQVFCKNHRSQGDPTRLPNCNPYPREEEAKELGVAVSKVFLDTTVLRYRESKLNEGGGAGPHQGACKEPHHDSRAGRGYMVTDLGGSEEYTGANLKAEDQGNTVDERQ